MPISQNDLAVAARAAYRTRAQSLTEAQRIGQTTAFLSHSHRDKVLAQGLASRLASEGFDVYIDWADTAMPPTPDRGTALRIQEKIRTLNLFIFLATENSLASRWCPWELGYADGKKHLSSILVVPTLDAHNNSYGNEYIQLYSQIEQTGPGLLATFEPGAKTGNYVRHFRMRS